MTERLSQSNGLAGTAPAAKQVSIALTPEGKQNQSQLAHSSKQRIEELRAQARKQKRVKKAT